MDGKNTMVTKSYKGLEVMESHDYPCFKMTQHMEEKDLSRVSLYIQRESLALYSLCKKDDIFTFRRLAILPLMMEIQRVMSEKEVKQYAKDRYFTIR